MFYVALFLCLLFETKYTSLSELIRGPGLLREKSKINFTSISEHDRCHVRLRWGQAASVRFESGE
jgi:hypothetical protein